MRFSDLDYVQVPAWWYVCAAGCLTKRDIVKRDIGYQINQHCPLLFVDYFSFLFVIYDWAKFIIPMFNFNRMPAMPIERDIVIKFKVELYGEKHT